MQDLHFLICFSSICMHRHMFLRFLKSEILKINTSRIFKKKNVSCLPTAFLKQNYLFFKLILSHNHKRTPHRRCRIFVVFGSFSGKPRIFLCFHIVCMPLHGGTIALFLCCWLMLVSDVCSFLLSFPCLIGAVVVCIGMISIDLY